MGDLTEKPIASGAELRKAIEDIADYVKHSIEEMYDPGNILRTSNVKTIEYLMIGINKKINEFEAGHNTRVRKETTELLNILSTLLKEGTLGQSRLLFEIEQFERRVLEGEGGKA